MLRRKITVIISILMAFTMVTGSALASGRDKDNDKDDQKDKHRKNLQINQVTVDFVSGELYIHGQNLIRKNRNPKVTLGGNELVVSSATSALVIASLQPGTLAGDYLLIVSSGRGETKRGSYDLTIGAVGLQGPQGPAGSDATD